MTDTTRLSQAPPARLSMNYAALRENGMELIRQYAGQSWTDHNVHDPGITLLEAFCYAITELGFRIQQEMPDLLRSGEVYTVPNLPPAHQMLPSAPVTVEDLRQVLLDHPDISAAQVTVGAAGEVDFYQHPEIVEAPESPPSEADAAPSPFVYTVAPGATAKRVAVQGLYEVMVVFREPDWNSNVYPLEVTVEVEGVSKTYALDIALPYWDDSEAAPFQAGLADAINTVTMQPLGTGEWRALDEPQSYFGNLQVSYGSEGVTLDLWVVLRITDNLDQSSASIAAIQSEARIALETVGPDSLIAQFANRVQAAYDGSRRIQQYVESWRNLGEVPVRLQVARQQEIGIRARIEVTRSTDLEQLLADIFVAIDLALSPPITFSSLAEQMQQGDTPEILFDGPLLRHGFLTATDTDTLARSGTIYTSDILRLMMQLRSSTGGDVVTQENPTGRDIVAVTDLALSNFVNNRPITTNARNCLTLVEVQRYRPRLSLAKSRITFVRNDLDIPYDLGRVADLIEQQAQPDGGQPQSFPPLWPVPLGEALPIDDYFPFQNDLPRLYGVGETGVPASAGKQGQARSWQTKGYLLLFEQFLADLTAQLGHINTFFSADPDQQTTYFTRALFDIPGTERLLKGFSGDRDDDWDSYIADPNNPYRQALQTAAESDRQFLDRRNRLFDHLLARQGETMVTWAQELHRWAQKDLSEALQAVPREEPLESADLLTAMETRRQAVNARLIQDKAAFLAAAPDLNANRLQAFGHPWRWQPELLQVEQTLEVVEEEPPQLVYRWQLVLEGEPRLRAARAEITQAAAIFTAEEAVVLATQSDFYRIVAAGDGRHRYQLTDTADMAADEVHPLGESPRTWTTEVTAETAQDETMALFTALRLQTSLTAMERRIAYLTGIRGQVRRRLITPRYAVDPAVTSEDPADLPDAGGYFEIYDEADADDRIEKRWRLWESGGRSGEVLLSSVSRFTPDNSDAEQAEIEAIAAARTSIQQVIRYGLDEWNYHISEAGADTFNFELRHPDGRRLALDSPPIGSEAETLANIHKTIDQLYSLYSAEGFHLVEHILLRPQRGPEASEATTYPGDEFLKLPSDQPDVGWEMDPYSYRLSLVLPSGYGRDFSPAPTDPDEESPDEESPDEESPDESNPETPSEAAPREVAPHRFRDLEFRRHLERVVEQSCPAHLSPRIYWVDRQDPENPIDFPALTNETAVDISFDQFEAIYFTWLTTQLIPGLPEDEVTTARNQMILALNALPH